MVALVGHARPIHIQGNYGGGGRAWWWLHVMLALFYHIRPYFEKGDLGGRGRACACRGVSAQTPQVYSARAESGALRFPAQALLRVPHLLLRPAPPAAPTGNFVARHPLQRGDRSNVADGAQVERGREVARGQRCHIRGETATRREPADDTLR